MMANTYFNGIFIPDSWIWKDGKLREDNATDLKLLIVQTLILVIEAGLLMLLMYYVNRWYLANVAKANNPNSIATWTAGIYAVITLTLIAIFIFGVSKM